MSLVLRNLAGLLLVLVFFAIIVGLPIYLFGFVGAFATAAALAAVFVLLCRGTR